MVKSKITLAVTVVSSLLFGTSLSALSETYRWIDDQGVMHFSDNPADVPEKYLPRIQKREQEDGGSIIIIEPPAKAGGAASQGANGNSAHDEGWWRSKFQALRNEKKTIEERLPTKREKLEELQRKRTLFHKASDRTAINDLTGDIERDEERIEAIGKELSDLDQAASRAGVPMEWRQ